MWQNIRNQIDKGTQSRVDKKKAFLQETLAMPSSQVKVKRLKDYLLKDIGYVYEDDDLFTALNTVYDEVNQHEGRFQREILRNMDRMVTASRCFGKSYQLYDPPWTRNEPIHIIKPDGLREEVFQEICDFVNQRTWELAQDLTDLNRRLLEDLHYVSGGRFLLLAAQHVTADKLKTLSVKKGWDHILHVYIHFAQARDIDTAPESERQEWINALREYPETTLKALLPVAPHARATLATALGWSAAIPLLRQIEAIGSKGFVGSGHEELIYDMPNSPDAESGVVDVHTLEEALALAGEELAQAVFALFNKANVMKRTIYLIEAVAGWNRESVEKGFGNHSQIDIKAYGTLPVNDEAEILQRYLALQESAKVANKFGVQRRATHAAAVEAGIANLAQLAGYTDVMQFEWDMEMQIGASIDPSHLQWQIDDYKMQAVIDGIQVHLVVERNGKTLKSVPKAIRQADFYEEAKAIVDQLRKQISRVRKGLLEGWIANGQPITQDVLKQLLDLPATRALLPNLVYRDEAGFLGLLDADSMTLIGLDHQQKAVNSSLIVAHPYHLHQANVLSQWQREIIQRRIVQPIKQVYRELYLLTPAEQTTRTYSNRFAGHMIGGAIAAKLFGSRHWRVKSDFEVTPYKMFDDMVAVFSLAGAYYYLGGDIPFTTDRVCFRHQLDDNRPDQWLPLEDVPPVRFSEVMRDADLVVSVAQVDPVAIATQREADRAAYAHFVHLSKEVYERRRELIVSLLDDLGLNGVTVEGHFAYVEGKLANYRVHLGSATIHIEPGNYLCIVPDTWGKKHPKLFLPFVDDGDRKISEVISKILLLLADDKIKDEQILRQISR